MHSCIPKTVDCKKKKRRLSEYLAVLLCCLTAFLSFLFFWRRFFLFPFRTRMSLHRQAPQRCPEKTKQKTLCSQPAEVVIDGTLNKKTEKERHTFCQAVEDRHHFYGGKCLSVVYRWEFPAVENSGMCDGSECSIYCFKQGGVITRNTSHSLPLWCHRATETQSRCLFSNNRHFSSSDSHSHWALLMALCCLHLFA